MTDSSPGGTGVFPESGGTGVSPEEEKKYAPECYACPIGAVSMAVQGAAPDATEHIIRAGREMLGAVRSLLEGMDAFLTMMEERSGGAGKKASVQSIPVRRNPGPIRRKPKGSA